MALLWRHRRASGSHLTEPVVAPPLSTPVTLDKQPVAKPAKEPKKKSAQ